MSAIKRKMVSQLLKTAPGESVLAKGWVRTKRGNKSVIFIALNDGSTINNIQIVCDPNHFSEQLLKDITTGACIAVEGELVESVGNADVSSLSPSMAGFVLSSNDGPNIIFSVVNGALAIQGINY